MARPTRVKFDYVLGFLLALTLFVSGAGVWHTRDLAASTKSLYTENLLASKYLSDAERGLWELRFALPSYLLADAESQERMRGETDAFRRQIDQSMAAYRALPITEEERSRLRDWDREYAYYLQTRPQFFELMHAGKVEEARVYRLKHTNPAAGRAVAAISDLIDAQRRIGADKQAHAEDRTQMATFIAVILSAVNIAVFMALGVMLRRAIFGSVERVQGSSAELSAAARQQLLSARDLATKTTEIGVSVQELVASSAQIAGVSGGVAQIALETRQSAEEGGAAVRISRETIAGIQRKVELIASHMLELGQKSREIGQVLGLIDELSEQTNILAINARIEAADGGEAARRFAVVADEIRRLADRVGESTREIRGLVSGVQAATDSTFIATQEGATAVDEGVRDFAAVLDAFDRIAGRIVTTTEAAREIELSTKQQISSVEQVGSAIADMLRATRELEEASGQTLNTSSELLQVSRGLAGMFVAGEAAA